VRVVLGRQGTWAVVGRRWFIPLPCMGCSKRRRPTGEGGEAMCGEPDVEKAETKRLPFLPPAAPLTTAFFETTTTSPPNTTTP